MSLPIDPIAALVAKVSEGLTAATNAGKAALPSIATAVEKAELIINKDAVNIKYFSK